MLPISLEAAGGVSMAEHRLCSRGSTKAGRDLKISCHRHTFNVPFSANFLILKRNSRVQLFLKLCFSPPPISLWAINGLRN